MKKQNWAYYYFFLIAIICFDPYILNCSELPNSYKSFNEMILGQINKMIVKPNWYNLLQEDFKSIDENRINLLENMRIRFRATHENMVLAIMSTAWACEQAQYSTLKELKRILVGQDYTDKSLWKEVLMGRFKTMESTRDIEPNNEKYQRIIKIVPILKSNIDQIINSFNSYDDEVKYVLCLENETGNLDDPTGTLIEMNKILGGRIPSSNDMTWFKNINNKFMNWK